jgi:hypothetical protein
MVVFFLRKYLPPQLQLREEIGNAQTAFFKPVPLMYCSQSVRPFSARPFAWFLNLVNCPFNVELSVHRDQADVKTYCRIVFSSTLV